MARDTGGATFQLQQRDPNDDGPFRPVVGGPSPGIPDTFRIDAPDIGLYKLSLPQYRGLDYQDAMIRALATMAFRNSEDRRGRRGGKKDEPGLFPERWVQREPGGGGGSATANDPFSGPPWTDNTDPFNNIPGMGNGIGNFGTTSTNEPTPPWGSAESSDLYNQLGQTIGLWGGSANDPTPSGPPVGGLQNKGNIANWVAVGLGGLGDILSWYQQKRNADKYRRWVEGQREETKRLAAQYSSPENFLYLLNQFLPRAREIASGAGAQLESAVAGGLARSGLTGTGIGRSLQGGAASAGQMEALRMAAAFAGQAQQQQLSTLGLSAFDPYNPQGAAAFDQPGIGSALQQWAVRSGLIGQALTDEQQNEDYYRLLLKALQGQREKDNVV